MAHNPFKYCHFICYCAHLDKCWSNESYLPKHHYIMTKSYNYIGMILKYKTNKNNIAVINTIQQHFFQDTKLWGLSKINFKLNLLLRMSKLAVSNRIYKFEDKFFKVQLTSTKILKTFVLKNKSRYIIQWKSWYCSTRV